MIDTPACKQLLNNNFYVRANYYDSEIVTTKSGAKFHADIDYAKETNAVQCGIIAAVPQCIENTYEKKFINDVELFIGDKIYFNHSVVQENTKTTIHYHIDPETKERLYICLYEQIYCVVRDGDIIMLEDYTLLSEAKETKEGIINPKFFQREVFESKKIPIYEQKLEQFAIVEHISNRNAELLGVKKGDKVFIYKNSDYGMCVEGNDYFRVQIRYILAVFETDD